MHLLPQALAHAALVQRGHILDSRRLHREFLERVFLAGDLQQRLGFEGRKLLMPSMVQRRVSSSAAPLFVVAMIENNASNPVRFMAEIRYGRCDLLEFRTTRLSS